MRPIPFLLFFALWLIGSTNMQAQCDSTQVKLVLDINPDDYPEEVSWRVTDITGKQVYFTGAPAGQSAQSFTYCVPASACLIFTILDTYGDGMLPTGSYSLTLDNTVIRNNPNGNYGFSESTVFNCGPGQYCDQALPIDTGLFTSHLLQSWYVYTPADTGSYSISTCGATCPTKIWVYDNCGPNLVVDSSNLGTIAYANAGCTDGSAALDLHLAGGRTYYIRIGYASQACALDSLPFVVSYLGPVVGCMDPTACNYNPLATMGADSLCIYPGDPDCNDLPDLLVDEAVVINTLQLDTENNADACLVQEGCIRGYGSRNLLRFSTKIDNIGRRDYYIGEPPASISEPNAQFVWDPCHGHWHYRGYAEYLLYDAAGNRLPIGAKTGFCVLDLYCPSTISGQYTCETMGITAGCTDEYDYNLPCQWVDLTGIPAGTYQLVVKVNSYEEPDRLGRPEITYENNYAQACFELSYSSNGTPDIDIIQNCSVVVDCSNTPFGPNVADCEGICNGGALIGDVNKDSLRNTIDTDWYLDQTMASSASTTKCNDLNGDGKFSLHDAALLQQCDIHGENPIYWGSRTPCAFPINIHNTIDKPMFRIQTINTASKYIDIQAVNPSRKQAGFDIQLSGVVIDSVKNQNLIFEPSFRIDQTTGRIVALAETEKWLPKSVAYSTILRVYYAELTNDTICLAVNETVNEFYERSSGLASTPACKGVVISSQDNPVAAPLEIIAFPNPADDEINVLIPEVFGRKAQLSLININGTKVRTMPTAGQDQLTIERKGLPSGVYILRIEDEQNQANLKVVFM